MTAMATAQETLFLDGLKTEETSRLHGLLRREPGESHTRGGCPIMGGDTVDESKDRLSWTVIGVLATLIMIIGGSWMGLLMWQLNNQNTEIKTLQAQVASTSVTASVHEIRLGTLDGKLSSIEGKLDRLLDRQVNQEAEARGREQQQARQKEK